MPNSANHLTPSHYERKIKVQDLRTAINNDEQAVYRHMAISDYGLVKDELRRVIWPKLISMGYFQCSSDVDDADDDLSSFCTCCSSGQTSEDGRCVTPSTSKHDEQLRNGEVWLERWNSYAEQLRDHSDYPQVAMDVRRTLARFPPNVGAERRQRLQEQLTPIVVAVLTSNASFRYYQGFHDVCLTALLVFDDAQQTIDFCKKLARTYFRPFLTMSLEVSCCKPLRLIYPLIYATDERLFAVLELSQVGVHFAVSWTLTWFAHVVDDYKPLVRLYDFFLASHPLAPVYLSAALVLLQSDVVLAECASDADMALVHHLLSQSCRGPFPVEKLVTEARQLFQKLPPTELLNLAPKAEAAARALQARHRLAARSSSLDSLSANQHSRLRRALVFGVAAAATAYYVYFHYSSTAWLRYT